MRFLDEIGLETFWNKIKSYINNISWAASSTPGGAAKKTSSIPYGEVDSTSKATAYTATVDGITELKDGVCVLLKNGVVTSATGFTININNLGAKPCYSNMASGYGTTAATRDTTIFNINYTMLFVYSEDIVSGGGWICYRGYDANTNTIGYQLRTNSSTLPVSDATYRYRLLFTSADNTHWVPANASTSTNATSKRDVNQTKINPFGPIVYYSYTTAISANANIGASYLWLQYPITFGYSFNRTGSTLVLQYPKPVYIKCAPLSDGSAIIDADEPYVLELPVIQDNKIYIYLGIAYSATAVELRVEHPVYYFKNGGIREWTGINDVLTANQIGNGLSLNNGILNVNLRDSLPTGGYDESLINIETDSTKDSYNIPAAILPWANTTRRGVVKVGDGLSIGNEAALEVNAGDGLNINTTTKELEVYPGNGLQINSNDGSIEVDSTVISGASKGATAIQPTDIKNELDPGGNGEIPDSAAIAEYVVNELADKVDKVSSTDNVVVRFDGTGGAIQNSGVTINDSNHVTAAKFITGGGTNKQFVKGDGSLDESNYLDIKRLPTSGIYIATSSCYLKLTMPKPKSPWMMSLGINVYSSYVSEMYIVGGYNYASLNYNWHSPSAIYLSSSTASKTIYFGKNDQDGGDGRLWVALPLGMYSHATVLGYSRNTNGFPIDDVEYSTMDINPDNWNAETDGSVYKEVTVVGTGSLASKANDSAVVHKAGAETISGVKTFSSGLKLNSTQNWSNSDRAIPFSAYGASTTIAYVNDDANKGLTYNPYTGALKAGNYVKRGGTSSQFLKADGSVDNNTYLTTQSIIGKADKSSLTITTVSNNETYNTVEGKKITIATNESGGTSNVDVVQLSSVKGAPSGTTNDAAKEIPTWQGVKEYVSTNSPAPIAGDGISITGSTINVKPATTSEIGGIVGSNADSETNTYRVVIDSTTHEGMIGIPNASSLKNGILSKDDYDIFTNKADQSNTYTKSEVNNLVSGIGNNVILGSLPETGIQNKIYRVPGTNSYTDYAWDGTQFVKLAEFTGNIFILLTKAEYDALSDEEKDNGTWYFIEEE